MRILVTGGAGYIGSHAAKSLARANFEPVVLDNLSANNADSVKWGPLIEGDISDATLVRKIIRDHRIEAVLHFAANAYVGESMSDPRLYFQNNVGGTLALLETMLDHGVKRIVFSSSCTTYGDPQHLPISEQHPQNPVSPYGDTKLFNERALHWF